MAKQQAYKRSWKNYLLDPGYQLRFTLTMVAVAAGLMAPLGYWVSEKANRATEVALNQLDGVRCPDVLVVGPSNGATTLGEDLLEEDLLDESPNEGDLLDEAAVGIDEVAEVASDEVAEVASDDDGDDAEPERQRAVIKVEIDDSEMPDAPVVVVGEMQEAAATPAEIQESKRVREHCLQDIVTQKTAIEDRKSLIRIVMVLSGLFLLLGLGVYGIKTTHGVAGPLFKVGLYLAKLEKNIYDTVYNLRKGDQLVAFYDHFKSAHAGARRMQEEDRDRLREAIALAKDADLTSKNPEMATVVAELEQLLANREASLDQDKA